MPAAEVSNCLPPWLDIQMASMPTESAIRASDGSMTPFKISFNEVIFLKSLINSHDRSPLKFSMKDYLGSSAMNFTLTPSSLKTSSSTLGRKLFLAAVLLFPKICVSAIKAIAWKPFSSHIFKKVLSVICIFHKR